MMKIVFLIIILSGSTLQKRVAVQKTFLLQNFAIADFYPRKGLGYERVMDRIAIEGDQPI